MSDWRGAARTAAITAALLALCASAPRADGIVRNPAADPLLDRNADGFQDVIVADREVHRDLDFDGVFDYTLTLAFKEYATEGHRRYLASGFAPDVFAELTRAGLDQLCASERVSANWTAVNFRDFLYYHDGYGRLQLFDGSPANDGRLSAKAPRPRYEYSVTFNPDGTVATVRQGDRTIELAAFDYDRNTSTGTRLTLPRIASPADLAIIRAKLAGLFATPAETR